MPKISVVIPVYNTEKYLHRCLDSILAQTFTDFELLLIDDGSTDQSGAICDEYAANYSQIRVYHKENGGVSSARNYGLDKACGEWIAFCDSDDWVYPGWLLNFANNWNDVDLVNQGVECNKSIDGAEDTGNSVIYILNHKGNASDTLTKLLENKIVGYLFIKCFKKSILELHNIKFNEAYKFKEDEDFVIRYMNYCGKLRSIDSVGYYYYVPNWANKYKGDLLKLEQSLELYRNVSVIYDNEKVAYVDRCLLDVVGGIMEQYKNGKRNYTLLKSILKETRKHISRLDQVSKLTRFMWTKNPIIVHLYLIFKSKILG